LTLGYEEDELFALVILFADVVACLDVFKFEAIDYPLDVFLAEPIEHFRCLQCPFRLVSEDN
jgi:hypothetical protein